MAKSFLSLTLRANSDFTVYVIFVLGFINIWFIMVVNLNNQMIKQTVDIIKNINMSTRSEL